MLIRLSEWDRISHHFSEEEKAALNLAITSETICPRGLTIDTGKLPDPLAAKLAELRTVPMRTGAGGAQ